MPVIKKSKKTKEKPFDIVFCVPGDITSMMWVWSWSDMLVKCLQTGLKIAFYPKYNCNIYYVRNACLGGNNLLDINQKPFQGKLDYKYICWIDTDTIPSFNGLQRLIKQDVDVVSGIYKMADMVHYAAVVKKDFDYYIKHNSMFQFLSEQDVKTFLAVKKNSKNIKDFLIEVDYAGMGFTLIKKGVFEKIKYPWFRPLPFTIPINGIKDFAGDDVSFCQLAQEAGFKIFVDIGLRCGHRKSIVI